MLRNVYGKNTKHYRSEKRKASFDYDYTLRNWDEVEYFRNSKKIHNLSPEIKRSEKLEERNAFGRYDADRYPGEQSDYSKYNNEDWLESPQESLELKNHMDKKRAFLLALQESPKSKVQNEYREKTKAKDKREFKSRDDVNSERLFVGNLFNSVENEDIERLLEPYGSIIEVRRYEKHAIVTLNGSKEKAEQATKDLDHNHWMDNWIRVKFDKFEMSKEEDWKILTKKVRKPFNTKYAHCDRISDNIHEDKDDNSESNQYAYSQQPSRDFKQSKHIDMKAKSTLSNFLKGIRHDHCIEVVDSIVKSKKTKKMDTEASEGSNAIIKGVQITGSNSDPRIPVDYTDVEFNGLI